MYWPMIEAVWDEVTDFAKEKWEKVPYRELNEIRGDRDRLECLLQTHYGISRDLAFDQVEEWATELTQGI